MSTRRRRGWRAVVPDGGVRGLMHVYRVAPGLEQRIRECERRVSLGGRDEAVARRRLLKARTELIACFARSYLPSAPEASVLVVKLCRFLEDHGDELGPALTDVLAGYLDPRSKEGYGRSR